MNAIPDSAGGRPPGRRKRPIAGEGPVKGLAEQLRGLREAAGRPTYKEMAARAHMCETSLSQADNGLPVPTKDVVHAYLRGCKVTDPAELAACERLYEAARAAEQNSATPPQAPPPAETLNEAPPLEADTDVPPNRTPLPLVPPVLPKELGHPATRLLRSPLGMATGGAALVAVIGSGVLTGVKVIEPASNGTPTGLHPTSPAPTSSRPVIAMAAHLTLNQLAQKTLTVADPPSSGRYACLRQWAWTREVNSPDMTEPYTVDDEQLWWAEDDSGRRVTTADADSDHPGPPQVQNFAPGDLRNPVEPPSETDAVLAGQLSPPGAAAPFPAGIVRGVAEIYEYRVFRSAQRAAILRVLSNTPGPLCPQLPALSRPRLPEQHQLGIN